ncbi:MAG: hypothetical protein DLM60_17510 [Pseudonocardiales bacterium]|nr:MAG: hypothetical protein DLM60_17510 [Pseudonocardiales bacterium]
MVLLLDGASWSPLPGGAPVSRLNWAPILTRAAAIVSSYDTSVTLRQLFYRLVSEQLLPNTDSSYKTLSAKTAELRRAGEFPDLIDRGRSIHRHPYFADATDALAALIYQFRLDRTTGQDVSMYLGVEKAGLVVQLESWFGDLGIPIVALGGYSSQSYISDILGDVPTDRPAILIYAGDYDPSGEDIDRDFVARTGCWDKVIRVALSAAQVDQYQLPPALGKATDSRAAAFIARNGELVQVELDALPPETLRQLYTDAITQHWDESAYASALEREGTELALLRDAAAVIGEGRW